MSYTSDGLDRFGRYTKPESVGDVLRRARENYGLDIEAVSESLKIRPHYLQAIEDARLHDLPGTAYAVGFVRSYADYLGLDSIELIRRFREEAHGATPQAELLVPQTQRERRFPGGAFLILSVVLAGVAYGGWYALSERDKVAVEAVPAVPAEMLAESGGTTERTRSDATVAVAATVDRPAAEAAPTAADTASGPHSGAAPDAPPAASQAEAAGTAGASPPAAAEAPAPAATQLASTTPAPVVPPAPVAPEVTPPAAGFVPQGQVYGVDNEDARIVILARLESWVRVSDQNQKPIWTRVLREGEAYQVPNDPSLTLTTGNAGGLEIYVDGKPVAPIGGVGMVSRNVPLDPASFSGGTTQSQ